MVGEMRHDNHHAARFILTREGVNTPDLIQEVPQLLLERKLSAATGKRLQARGTRSLRPSLLPTEELHTPRAGFLYALYARDIPAHAFKGEFRILRGRTERVAILGAADVPGALRRIEKLAVIERQHRACAVIAGV